MLTLVGLALASSFSFAQLFLQSDLEATLSAGEMARVIAMCQYTAQAGQSAEISSVEKNDKLILMPNSTFGRGPYKVIADDGSDMKVYCETVSMEKYWQHIDDNQMVFLPMNPRGVPAEDFVIPAPTSPNN